MSSFQDWGFSFTITLRQKPVTRMPRWMTRQRESTRITPLGLCLRVIVNEKPLNFEKSTSSVLSVLLLIYACPYGLPDSHIWISFLLNKVEITNHKCDKVSRHFKSLHKLGSNLGVKYLKCEIENTFNDFIKGAFSRIFYFLISNFN